MKALRSNINRMLTLKELRDDKRYKQIDIARETGIHQSVLSRMMNNDDISNFTLGTAQALAEWLGCSIDELIKDDAEDA